GTATASFNTSSLTVGTHTVAGSYSGDTNFSASASAAITQTVTKASSTIAVVASANPTVWGQGVTFTATVTSSGPGNPTGVVTFSDGSASIGQGTLSTSGGTATASFSTSSLTVATHTLTISYGGDGNFLPRTASVTQTVGPASTSTVVASSANPSASGPGVAFPATISICAPGRGTTTG